MKTLLILDSYSYQTGKAIRESFEVSSDEEAEAKYRDWAIGILKRQGIKNPTENEITSSQYAYPYCIMDGKFTDEVNSLLIIRDKLASRKIVKTVVNKKAEEWLDEEVARTPARFAPSQYDAAFQKEAAKKRFEFNLISM